MPDFLAVREEHTDDVNWLFVATDEVGDPKQFVTDKGWDPSLFALGSDIKSYHKGPNPTTYFYDSSGKLVETVKGGIHKEDLQEKVAALQ
ncbi:hypothetical protein KDL44_03295 [bacterium]|nr:hypothetical protein [bacterium]